jgi:hypothetical protein
LDNNSTIDVLYTQVKNQVLDSSLSCTEPLPTV